MENKRLLARRSFSEGGAGRKDVRILEEIINIEFMEIKILDVELERFIYFLEKQTIAKVVRTIELLEMFGNELGMPHSKKIDSGLFELRVRGAQEVRIIYTFHKRVAVLLVGFIKKSEKIPRREIERARLKLVTIDFV